MFKFEKERFAKSPSKLSNSRMMASPVFSARNSFLEPKQQQQVKSPMKMSASKSYLNREQKTDPLAQYTSKTKLTNFFQTNYSNQKTEQPRFQQGQQKQNDIFASTPFVKQIKYKRKNTNTEMNLNSSIFREDKRPQGYFQSSQSQMFQKDNQQSFSRPKEFKDFLKTSAKKNEVSIKRDYKTSRNEYNSYQKSDIFKAKQSVFQTQNDLSRGMQSSRVSTNLESSFTQRGVNGMTAKFGNGKADKLQSQFSIYQLGNLETLIMQSSQQDFQQLPTQYVKALQQLGQAIKSKANFYR